MNLNVVETEVVTRIIGNNYNASNFTWKSTNPEIATVDSQGQVVGLKDRIYNNLCQT